MALESLIEFNVGSRRVRLVLYDFDEAIYQIELHEQIGGAWNDGVRDPADPSSVLLKPIRIEGQSDPGVGESLVKQLVNDALTKMQGAPVIEDPAWPVWRKIAERVKRFRIVTVGGIVQIQ